MGRKVALDDNSLSLPHQEAWSYSHASDLREITLEKLHQGFHPLSVICLMVAFSSHFTKKIKKAAIHPMDTSNLPLLDDEVSP